MLLRHGQTGDNLGGRFQGQRDTPLDQHGREQAQRVARLLASVGPTRVLSSDLDRAVATAEPVATLLGQTVDTDPRLRELDLGTWQGLTSEQAAAQHPQEHAAWTAGHDVRRGGGESYQDAGRRAAQCLLPALDAIGDGELLLAVSHGGTIRGALGVLLEQDPTHWWRYGSLTNCAWSLVVEHRLGWRLERHNTGLSAELGEVPATVPPPVGAASSPDAEPVG